MQTEPRVTRSRAKALNTREILLLWTSGETDRKSYDFLKQFQIRISVFERYSDQKCFDSHMFGDGPKFLISLKFKSQGLTTSVPGEHEYEPIIMMAGFGRPNGQRKSCRVFKLTDIVFCSSDRGASICRHNQQKGNQEARQC